MTPVLQDSLFNWPHAVMIGGLLAPFLLFWLDSRRQGQKHHDESFQQNARMHRENQDRLLRIETQLEPIVDWWNEERRWKRGGG